MTPEDKERYARYTRADGEAPELGLLIEALIDDLKGYLEAQQRLVTLQASEKAGRLVAILLLALVVTVLVGGVLVMLSVALALWLGEVFGDIALGFLATGGIHLLLTLLFYLLWKSALRERIILAVVNAVHETD
jgi:hypothetical protein